MIRTLRTYGKLLLWAIGAKEGTMLETGQSAPPFSIPDETGRMRSLDEFRGKTLVLWFYPKADTPG